MKRSYLNRQSKLPKRVQKRRAASEHAREHHERVKHCEAPAHGVTTPCSGRLQHSHRIGLGMGGGKDYAVSDGECDILCQQHHIEIDTRRAEMRAAGLVKKRPPSDKTVPRSRFSD
jgi:hypothetical protein